MIGVNPISIALYGQVYPLRVSLIALFGYGYFSEAETGYIPDHADRAVSLLIEQFKRKQKFVGMVRAFADEVQVIENMERDMFTLRRIASATGAQLDIIGELVGEKRLERSDDDYRQAIYFRIYINCSGGQPEVIIAACKIFGKAVIVKYTECYPAHVILYTDGEAVYDSDVLSALQRIAPAGVKINLISFFDGVMFSFDWDTYGLPPFPTDGSKGFDEWDTTNNTYWLEAGQHIGGQLTEYIL